MKTQPIFSDDYLASVWATEFEEYKASHDAAVLARLQSWDERDLSRTETEVSDSFVQQFFRELWGYWMTGERSADEGYCMTRESKVAGAGQGGGKGAADLAIGWYGRGDVNPVDQVLCEFKDIRSSLDAPQNRKGNSRSPVKQCFDYLRYAFDQTPTNSAVRPAWGIATDMNEFRLYLRRLGEGQVQRFVIRPRAGESRESLLDEGDAGCLRRFLFSRLFHRDLLLSERGPTALEQMLDAQGLRERALEEEFYREYSAFRETLFDALVAHNPEYADSKWKLVRHAQRLLDRLLFVLFAEDMGGALRFPKDLLRDILAGHSCSMTYDPEDTLLWAAVKKLFHSMAEGVPFGIKKWDIPRFNGGLFQDDADLDGLRVPTKVFCVARQGETPEEIFQHPQTLLYFSAKYNFGTTGAQQQRTIGLYALGRIFEQSLTDLEVLEARAAGRESLAEITKRKRDGVYYTPEWVTSYIVNETVGRRLDEIKTELGLQDVQAVSDDDIRMWRRAARSKRQDGTPGRVEKYRNSLDAYVKRLERFTVVDPACGSGAFLIQALELMLRERRWVAEERKRIEEQMLFDQDTLVRETLANNIYGVDINAESVEITKLALWLHTALPGKPLCALDDNIRCGNSLVGPEFTAWYSQKRGQLFAQVDEGVQAEVNVFDWPAAFPKVFSAGGFDAVIGNPPYVKLQHFRRVEADVAEYLVEGRRPDGSPLYRSTQTGNFDLYLPFIEKGISLLKKDGRMGFIAPSLWLVNKYGVGLKGVVREARSLDRWVDFQSFQVFREAITYTALQFFRGVPSTHIAFALNPSADLSHVEWDVGAEAVPYRELPDPVEAWNLLPRGERLLLGRLRSKCQTLADSSDKIVVGIQTSADSIYHLRLRGPGVYYRKVKGETDTQYEIEDALMRPLVSGEEAKRYQTPATDTYLLFPYDLSGGTARLWSQEEMECRFPRGWDYLRHFEADLRGREKGKMDHDGSWWAYNYPKNLDKQERPKLLVPRLVNHLVCALDEGGAFFMDNVDVGGVLVQNSGDIAFFAAVLNSPVADFVFRRTSKPFQNDYRSANKQFIAPLPVPSASDEQKAAVGEQAKRLQELHTQRRDLAMELDQRLNCGQCEAHVRGESWFWATIKDTKHWKKNAPPDLRGREVTAWARAHYHVLLGDKLATVDNHLTPGSVLTVHENRGELTVRSHVHVILQGYDETTVAPFVATQWRHALRNVRVSEAFNAKALLRLLLKIRRTDNTGLRDQVVNLDQEIQQLDAEIAAAEGDLNEIIHGLYGLTDEERRMVEQG